MGSCIVIFSYRILSIIPYPFYPGFVFKYIPLNGLCINAFLKVILRTQFISVFGGTVPIVKPTPNLTVIF